VSYRRVRLLVPALIPASVLWLSTASLLPAAPSPAGLWEFGDPADPLRATIGQDLRLEGSQIPLTGVHDLDGEVILVGASQTIDGRFALDSTILFFADENGEDAPIDITTLAIFDLSLSDADAAELGGPPPVLPDNAPPLVVTEPLGLAQVSTGQEVVYQVTVQDSDQDLVQAKIDWGDGEDVGYGSRLTSDRTTWPLV